MTQRVPVYWGYKLTDAPPEYIREMEALAGRAFELMPECERIKFLGLTWNDPLEVFESDIEQGVRRAKAVVLIRDLPSDGIIVELCEAISAGIPVLMFHKPGVKVSGLVRGLVRKHSHAALLREYRDECDIVVAVRSALRDGAIFHYRNAIPA